ncbi:MAG: glycerate kinase [Opitutus sp.]|nr:glycerate kinase [Opitutus sp.]
MRVLLAFDKFKDSLSAQEACTLAAAALAERHPDWIIDACPLSDGGEGFSEILTAAAGGRAIVETVTGPRDTKAQASIGIVSIDRIPIAARALLPSPPSGGTSPPTIAVIDMASASGLALLKAEDRDLWQTTTVGTGELIRRATELGVTAILLGVGGSATHDLGLGALAALGVEFQSSRGERIFPPVPVRWREIDRLDGKVSALVPPIRIACDVSNPLLGPRGAAATYGPQKGLRAADLSRLDHESARLAMMLCAHCGRPDSLMDTPGAGAAGGISFGFMTAAGAQLVPGFDLVSAWLDLETRLAAADLVITGEGRFDDSSLQGKGPGAVAARALALGKKVHVFAGSATAAHPPANLALHSITSAGVPLDQALRQAAGNLGNTVREVFGKV